MSVSLLDLADGTVQTKPWLNIVCNNIECKSLTVEDEVISQNPTGGYTTDGTLTNVINTAVAVNALSGYIARGSSVGSPTVSVSQFYAGNTWRGDLQGSINLTNGAAQTLSLSLVWGGNPLFSTFLVLPSILAPLSLSIYFDVRIDGYDGLRLTYTASWQAYLGTGTPTVYTGVSAGAIPALGPLALTWTGAWGAANVNNRYTSIAGSMLNIVINQ